MTFRKVLKIELCKYNMLSYRTTCISKLLKFMALIVLKTIALERNHKIDKFCSKDLSQKLAHTNLQDLHPPSCLTKKYGFLLTLL